MMNRREAIGALGAIANGAYASRGTNPMTNTADGIFADSLASELVTPTGSTAGGYAAIFQVAIAL